MDIRLRYRGTEITDDDIAFINRLIAAHPQDWHMLQPLWLADLSTERRAYLEGG